MRAWSKFVALPLLLAGGIVMGLQSPAAAPEPSPGPSAVVFALEVAGVDTFQLSRCAGIGSETDVIEFASGGAGGVSHVPGDTAPLQLTCMRGYSADPSLAQWREAIVDGDADPTSATLTMYDSTLAPLATWTYYGIWPRTLVVQLDGSGIPYEVVSFVADHVEQS